VVRYGTPEHALGRDRRAWAKDLQSVVAGLLAPLAEPPASPSKATALDSNDLAAATSLHASQ